ncbi:MAG: hypothetical protein H6P98_2603 [Candidatus Aminicenantes bacterium]|nr:hypothetical protein [Candidatus Aminicenantes bacterium]
MRKFGRFIAFFVFSSLLLSQSVVDAAKKEQERREKLKGKNAKVVTNADLKTIKRGAAVETSAATEASAAETEAEEYPSIQEPEGAADEGFGPAFASQILADTTMVENPDYALGSPDDRYAELSLYGILELGLAVRNGDGPDIVVHGRISGLEEMAGGEEEGVPAGFLAASQPGIPPMYGVLVLDEMGVWQAIGKDTGSEGPASFDLGGIPSTKRIRIIFQYLDVPDLGTAGTKPLRTSEKEITMGVDAVEALH